VDLPFVPDQTQIDATQTLWTQGSGHLWQPALEGAKDDRGAGMDWYGTVFEMIDMRSFSNLWFWIVLAVVWSSTSHWVIGVPFDMVARARRNGGQAEQDLEDLARINANRLIFIVEETGLWLAAIVSALLTGLAMLGFVYDVEFSQAVFLLAFPMSLVFLLSIASARRIVGGEGQGEALWRRLRIHRFISQVIGMFAIFATAFWGMYQNMQVHVL
jgi:hypothetical protein